MEIERKFLVKEFPSQYLQYIPKAIEQGYMAIEDEGNTVRLRRKGGAYFLTVKSLGTLVREERETNITKAQFDILWGSTEGRRIVKERYEIPHGEFLIELDVFKGKLEGLMMAEVEFESVEEAMAFQKLEWMGRELTENTHFTNSQLQQCTDFESVMQFLLPSVS